MPAPVNSDVIFLEPVKTYPLTNKQGRLHAFEISNLSVGRRGVVKIIKKISGSSIEKEPKIFSWSREAEFCRFKVESQQFSVEEPFGDNSRYLVRAEPPGWCPQMEIVEKSFRES